MNRYKFKEADFKAAIHYIKTGKNQIDAPNWAIKKKDELTIKGKKVFFKNMEIIAEEKIDDYLREAIYSKDGTMPFGRDSIFHKMKATVIGIPRRRVMDFLRAQKTLGETRPAIPGPKVKSGPRLKKLTLETDLVFVKKADVVQAQPRLEKKSTRN